MVKNPPTTQDEGHVSSIPWWGRFPGEGSYNPLLYSRLGYPTNRGTWWATVHGVGKSDTTERLNNKKILSDESKWRGETRGRQVVTAESNQPWERTPLILSESLLSVCALPYSGWYALKMLALGDFNSGAV